MQKLKRFVNTSVASSSSIPLVVKMKGNCAILSINRPQALNALNVDICSSMLHYLSQWQRENGNVGCFILKGEGAKAFCAGGDVKSIWHDVCSRGNMPTGGEYATTFFSTEYRMNYALGTCRIPQISIWDGIVMGGGVGISIFGKFRIATEKTVFSMPETAIGLFPDVGSSYWLPKLKNGYGEYIGLTGCLLKYEDLVRLGIATHFIPSSKIASLEQEISEKVPRDIDEATNVITSILASYEERIPTQSKVILDRDIEHVFYESDFVEDIMLKLARINNDQSKHWAENTLDVLKKASPTSLKLTLRQISTARQSNMSLRDCLKMVTYVIL